MLPIFPLHTYIHSIGYSLPSLLPSKSCKLFADNSPIFKRCCAYTKRDFFDFSRASENTKEIPRYNTFIVA
ncbi:hypothetical protein BcDW1_5987 [Botrytis cinerea BcDW1]|uniref:Uncharacterized protein n=1 Tax=Botryotinia fuckeliana (strain BcDW1) TaxID=1290391 RepID=M7UFD7_BOTF1|nr:hypothetical protein BcDW1_5987 [Botrytis cinerea BcDW1]